MKEVVIVSACRTPIGAFQGSLSQFTSPQLGAFVIKEIISRTKISPEIIDEVIMGNVLTCGVGQSPTRQAAIFAGLNESVQTMTINKVCGSGLKSVMLATQSIKCGDANTIIAGGMESMSNVPYILEKARTGYRFGNSQLVDSIIKDGLWDVYNNFHMGNAAEICASESNISRNEQDLFAIQSYKRAIVAQEKKLFAEEIVSIQNGNDLISEDDEPKKVKFEKIPNLKPAFQKDGTVTAANASKINDGAAAILLMSKEKAEELNIKPLAKFIVYLSFAKKPEHFTTAPIDVIEKLFKKNNFTKDEIDLFEINEAFSVVTLAAEKKLNLDPEKVNVNGGAVALGHPIGASGARILTTLIYALKQRNLKRGLASICIGGGEASGIIIEMI